VGNIPKGGTDGLLRSDCYILRKYVLRRGAERKGHSNGWSCICKRSMVRNGAHKIHLQDCAYRRSALCMFYFVNYVINSGTLSKYEVSTSVDSNQLLLIDS